MAQTPIRRRDRWAALAVLLFLTVVPLLQIAAFHDLRHDDAFITFRYGANLADGRGLVFNPDERVMGSTSPLHSLLSAGVYSLVGKERLPSAMSALGCLAWSLQALAAFFLLRRPLGSPWALLVALGLAAGAAWSFEWVALETTIAGAFATAALASGVSSRWTWSAFWLALAGLTRPDAYLLGLPLGLLALPEARRGETRVAPPLVAFAAVTVPWFVFAQTYFGTVLPQSANAKVGRTEMGRYLAHLIRDPNLGLFPGRDGTGWWMAGWLLAALGAYLLVRRERRLWVLPAYGALHFVAYLLLRPFVDHRWHLYPLSWVVALCALSALASLPRLLPAERADGARGSRLLRPLAAVLLVGLIAAYGARSAGWGEMVEDGYWWGARHKVYRQAAYFLREQGVRSTDTIATVEVGTLAYYADVRVFDLGGLVTRAPEDFDDWPRIDWGVWAGFQKDDWVPPRVRPVRVFEHNGFSAHIYHVPGARFSKVKRRDR